jgi:branched-chain amino acid transport system permease protein
VKLFLLTFLNGLTLAALYFIVASGFTLIFGLMRNVNLAHGSLYLGGGYLGWEAAQLTDNWFAGAIFGFVAAAAAGVALQVGIFRRMEGQDLRQTLVTIAISIIAADVMLWIWGGNAYQFSPPDWLFDSTALPIAVAHRSNGAPVWLTYPTYRLVLLGIAIAIGLLLYLLLARTRIGMMIRAGVDDRGMLAASGINVPLVFAVVFALGAGLAGFAGVIGGTALSLAPGEDVRYLLASLVVVIVGGMGSIAGAALGALMIGLAEQFGLAYVPTYGIVFTFVIMVAALAVRPQGLLSRAQGRA